MHGVHFIGPCVKNEIIFGFELSALLSVFTVIFGYRELCAALASVLARKGCAAFWRLARLHTEDFHGGEGRFNSPGDPDLRVCERLQRSQSIATFLQRPKE